MIVIKSFSITPVKNPINDPNAALKANFVSELLLNSPAKAPMNGPKIIPIGPNNKPIIKPIVEPITPNFVPPNNFVPHIGVK